MLSVPVLPILASSVALAARSIKGAETHGIFVLGRGVVDWNMHEDIP